MTRLLTTKEVAELLKINEKKVYTLIQEQGLPASKATGKWLFPEHLVLRWLENATLNVPKKVNLIGDALPLIIIAGSNDLLLDKTMALFRTLHPDYLVCFANVGSMGGVQALRRGACHMATSHLLDPVKQEYNFSYLRGDSAQPPAVVNFCRRQQGLILAKGNPKGIHSLSDLAQPGLTMVNRSLGTGTRLWFDQFVKAAGLDPARISGYANEVSRHWDVALAVFSGLADFGPGIESVASLLGLDFLPVHWERFDLLIGRDVFFERQIQEFLSLLHDDRFVSLAEELTGYDLQHAGQMVYPGQGGQ